MVQNKGMYHCIEKNYDWKHKSYKQSMSGIQNSLQSHSRRT
jgi:hypothetical protein